MDATINAADVVKTSELATPRMAVYQFLAAAFGKPSVEQHAWLTGDGFASSLERLCEAFGVPSPPGALFPSEAADHEARFLACFEVGFPAAPVPLLASHYNRREPVPRTVHEHILFYKRFGARLESTDDPADHLLHELAFLVRLDELLLDGRVEAESLLRARHDFLARHVARWTGQAARAAEETRLPPVYCALLTLLDAAVKQDLELTREAVRRLPELTR